MEEPTYEHCDNCGEEYDAEDDALYSCDNCDTQVCDGCVQEGFCETCYEKEMAEDFD